MSYCEDEDDTPIIFSSLILPLCIFTLTQTFSFKESSIRAIFILTVFPVSRFMRSDVKMNLLFKLFSPKGKELNLFFFGTDLVLSGDESMTQARNGKS